MQRNRLFVHGAGHFSSLLAGKLCLRREVIQMISKEEMDILNTYANEILEVIYTQDEYTTSDLQGRVDAIVLRGLPRIN
jgi:hypothetical protein